MTYTYRYTDSKGGEVEINHPMSDDARTKHKGRPVVRMITGSPSFKFNGTGFYETDYKNK